MQRSNSQCQQPDKMQSVFWKTFQPLLCGWFSTTLCHSCLLQESHSFGSMCSYTEFPSLCNFAEQTSVNYRANPPQKCCKQETALFPPTKSYQRSKWKELNSEGKPSFQLKYELLNFFITQGASLLSYVHTLEFYFNHLQGSFDPQKQLLCKSCNVRSKQNGLCSH